MGTHGVGTFLINSKFASGSLVFYEKTVGRTATGDVLTVGTGAVKVGGTSQDVDFQFYGTGSLSAIIDTGAATLTLVGITTTTDKPLTASDTTDTSSGSTGAINTLGGLGVTKKVFVGTDLIMGGGDIDMSAGATGTYDIILKDAVADALSIKRATTDMIVFNSTTPLITITPATTVTGKLTANGSIDVVSAGTIAGLGTGANGIVLKNLKNDTAMTLGGTHVDVEIDIGGTPYYFAVYPTRS